MPTEPLQDPHHITPDTGYPGDNDPIDALEIGYRMLRTGIETYSQHGTLFVAEMPSALVLLPTRAIPQCFGIPTVVPMAPDMFGLTSSSVHMGAHQLYMYMAVRTVLSPSVTCPLHN